MAAPWIKLQIESSRAAFRSFISAACPPKRLHCSALFLDKLITRVQPGRSSAHKPTPSHLGWDCSNAPNQSWRGKGSSPEQTQLCTPRPLTAVSISHYSDNNCIRFFKECRKNTTPTDPLTGRSFITPLFIHVFCLNCLIDQVHWLFINASSLLLLWSEVLTLPNPNVWWLWKWE